MINALVHVGCCKTLATTSQWLLILSFNTSLSLIVPLYSVVDLATSVQVLLSAEYQMLFSNVPFTITSLLFSSVSNW